MYVFVHSFKSKKLNNVTLNTCSRRFAQASSSSCRFHSMSCAAFGWLEVNLAASTFSSRTLRPQKLLLLCWVFIILRDSSLPPFLKPSLRFMHWPVMRQLTTTPMSNYMYSWKTICRPVNSDNFYVRWSAYGSFLFPQKTKLSLSSQSSCLTHLITELMPYNVQVDNIFVIIPFLPMQPSLSPTLHVSSAGPGH